tara:strand:+ start:70 stop:477 length:408 start_codon:yes stop_codon:yes gene_type:complete
MRVLFLIALLSLVRGLSAEDYVVVVAKDSPITVDDAGKIREIFLKKRNFDNQTRVIPINLIGEERVRTEFETQVLQMSRDEINRYWITSHFQGVSPPTTQASLQSVKRFIQSVNGAIGYLPRDMVDADLKIIYEF